MVLEGHARFCAVFRAEVFVLSQFSEADEFWAVQRMTIDLADALNTDEAVRAVVSNRAFHAGLDREFFGAEELFAINFAVNNPAIDETFVLSVSDGDGFKVVIIFEFWIDVTFPIQLIDNPVKVQVFGFGHVFDEERPGNFAALDQRLIHAEDVAAPLRFISAKGTGGVKNARRNQPTSAGLEAIGARKIEYAIVAFVPIFKATADLTFGRARFEAHECVREIVTNVVVLGWKIVRLGFAFLADEFGLLRVLMHVMRNRAHVIEELGIDGPLPVFLPNLLADDRWAAFGNCLAQGETLFAGNDVAETFVGRPVFVGGGGCGGEPTFVNAAAIEAKGVEIVRVKFEALARLEKRARDPTGCESKQAPGILKRGFDEVFNILRDSP